MIEQQAMLPLLTEAEQHDYFIEINLDGLIHGDILSRYRAYSFMKALGCGDSLAWDVTAGEHAVSRECP